MGELFIGFIYIWWGSAKVQGDRKALPVTPQRGEKHLAVPRAAATLRPLPQGQKLSVQSDSEMPVRQIGQAAGIAERSFSGEGKHLPYRGR